MVRVGRGIVGIAALGLVACSAAAPRATQPTQRPPANASAKRAANPAAPRVEPPSSAPAAPERPAKPPRIAHEYRRIYDDWAHVYFREGRPLLVSLTGAADLSSGLVLFERDFRNGAIFEGDSLWFADGFSPMSACPEPSVLVQLTGDQWRPRRDANVHDFYVSPWLEGSSLAAVVPMRAGPPWGYELMVLEKNRSAPVPERSGPLREAGCHTRLSNISALEAFRTGEIFVFGSECPLLPKEDTNDLAEATGDEATATEVEGSEPAPTIVVESFARGERRSTFTVLPLRELTSTFGVAGDDVWAAGSVSDSESRILHFDGKSWTTLPEPFAEPVVSLFVPAGESGVSARRFFVSGKRLFEVSQGSTREHALPGTCDPLNVQLVNEQLWLLCSVSEYEVALFTTDPHVQPVHFSDDPDRSRVSWSEKPQPLLDPQGPRLRGCEHEHALDVDLAPAPRPSPQPGSKTTGKPSASPRPGKPVPGRKTRTLDLDFGY